MSEETNPMKKERVKPQITGSYILDEQGNLVEINPKEIPSIANQCGAFVKLLETGKPHSVIK
jgi:hypothetical protein